MSTRWLSITLSIFLSVFALESARLCAMSGHAETAHAETAPEAPLPCHDAGMVSSDATRAHHSTTPDCADHGDTCMVDIENQLQIVKGFAVDHLVAAPIAILKVIAVTERHASADFQRWITSRPVAFSPPPASITILLI